VRTRRRTERLHSADSAEYWLTRVTDMQNAEAEAAAQRTLAEAENFSQQQAAEGIRAKMLAQAEGLQKMLEVASPDLVKFHLALEHGLFEKLAGRTAEAVRGMQPKINVWNTGASGAGGAADAMAPIRSLFTSLPPMLDALSTQTDIKMPSWMPNQNGASSGAANGAQGATMRAATNVATERGFA
jgi:flotillin